MEKDFLKPYWEDGEIRIFDTNCDDEEYVWHKDLENREIEILEGNGWQFQFEGCLPYLLEKGMVFSIEKNEMHRLIKGIDNLKIRIVRHGH